MDGEPAPGAGGAGADPNPGAVFDSKTFGESLKAELMTEIRKDLNGISKSLKTDMAKIFKDSMPVLPTAVIPPVVDPPLDPANKGGDSGLVAGLTAQLTKLKGDSDNRIRALEDENTATKARAEETDRHSKIRSKLASFTFVNPALADAAFKLFSLDIKRDDAGELVAGDLGYEQYIEAQMNSHYGHFLATKDPGGAGARNGNNRPVIKSDFTMDDLTPAKIAAMKPEDRQRLNTQMAALARTL